VLLTLSNTKDDERDPIHMERVFAQLHQRLTRRQTVRLMYGSLAGQTSLILDTPDELAGAMTRQLYAEYPTVDVETIEAAELSLPDDAVVWHQELTLRPDLYPIQRFRELIDRSSRQLSDPLSSLLEAVGPGDHSEVRPYIELTIKRASFWRRWRTQRAVQRLAYTGFLTSSQKSQWFALAVTHRLAVVRGFGWLWGCWARGERLPSTDDLSESSDDAHQREQDLTAANEKVGSFLFEVSLRIVSIAPQTTTAEVDRRLQQVAAVLSALARPRLATFQRAKVVKTNAWPNRSRCGFLLCCEELATLFHPPTRSVAAANVKSNSHRKLEPPLNLPSPHNDNDVLSLGRMLFRSQESLFGIHTVDRRRHIYIPGRTGMGKSTLILNMVLADLHAGRGVGVLDPHGDLATRIIENVPKRRWDDLVIFDPADTAYPVSYNPLDARGLGAGQRGLVAAGVLSVFKHLFADSFHAAARMEDLFRNAFHALADAPDTTLLSLPRFLRDEQFRNAIAARVENQVVREFWLQTFPAWSNKYRSDSLAPVENKVRHLMTDPVLQRILGQPHSKINLRQIMDEGKILIVDLSKGKLGEDSASLLGSLLVTKLQLDAMSRADIPEEQRRDFHLYCDEFQNFVTGSFATILSEARKYRLSLTLAHQYLGQLRDTRDAIFGNVGTTIAFSTGYEDANVLAQAMGGGLTPNDLVHLPKYHAYIALMLDGKTSDPFLMRTLNPAESPQSAANLQRLRTLSRQRYAAPAEAVDQQLQKLLVAV
jgi:hypothetical protein